MTALFHLLSTVFLANHVHRLTHSVTTPLLMVLLNNNSWRKNSGSTRDVMHLHWRTPTTTTPSWFIGLVHRLTQLNSNSLAAERTKLRKLDTSYQNSFQNKCDAELQATQHW